METTKKFQNQVALICGGSGRVGEAIAKQIAGAGANTIIQYRKNKDQALRLVEEIRRSGGLTDAIQMDVTDEASVTGEIINLQTQFGGVHILVNTVHGQFVPKEVREMDWVDWNVHLEALKGQFNLCKAVVPVMRDQGYGRIVYISGGLARRYFKGCAAYTTIKAGLNGFCKTLAIEEGCHGITVNIVAPGKVEVSDGRESTDNPDAFKEMNEKAIVNNPLGRHATAEEVAQAVLYFAGPDSGGITGQTLYVAGGEIMP